MSKNGKRIIIFFFYVLLVKGSYSQIMPMKKIIVKKVSVLITTPINISCEAFEQSFSSDQISERVITDSVKLKQSEAILSNILYDSNDLQNDIRFKFYFYPSGDTPPIVLCMDRFQRVILNGKKTKKNKKMIQFLIELSSDKIRKTND